MAPLKKNAHTDLSLLSSPRQHKVQDIRRLRHLRKRWLKDVLCPDFKLWVWSEKSSEFSSLKNFYKTSSDPSIYDHRDAGSNIVPDAKRALNWDTPHMYSLITATLSM